MTKGHLGDSSIAKAKSQIEKPLTRARLGYIIETISSCTARMDLRATLIGLHATFTGIGLLPASLLAGFLWNVFGPQATFYFGGGMGALAAVALLFLI
jgi:hypothetical protein